MVKMFKLFQGGEDEIENECCDVAYLAVISVEGLQLLDVVHVDALRQRLSPQVRRGELRQGVGCVYVERKGCHSHGHLGSNIVETKEMKTSWTSSVISQHLCCSRILF